MAEVHLYQRYLGSDIPAISLGTQTFQVPGRVLYMGVGGEKGETSGRASIESEFGSRRTHRKP